MSSPRDDDRPGDDPRDPRDGPRDDPRPGEPGWQEPVHLGKDDRAGRDEAPTAPGGQWAGATSWDTPTGRTRRPPRPGVAEQVFRYQGDTVGAQGWALQHGWTVSDGTAPEDAALAELVATAPVRATRDHRPTGVMRGRVGTVELVAFDITFVDKRYSVPEYAVTAAPVLLPLPGLRLSPVRFWRHRTGGLLHVPSGDDAFDARWALLTAEDGLAVRRLVGDETVRGLLLGSDDGDEFWAAAGHLAAVRPDGQRPELIEHHARLLGAMVAALAGAA